MARDPDLQRSAGANSRRFVVERSHIVLQWRSDCIEIPRQHLDKVLHFVCELRLFLRRIVFEERRYATETIRASGSFARYLVSNLAGE